jgi:hypothetical protein
MGPARAARRSSGMAPDQLSRPPSIRRPPRAWIKSSIDWR